jgi:hypothetical protein
MDDDSFDDRERGTGRDRAPEWRGKLRADAARREPAWHLFRTSATPGSWLLNLALLIALCIIVMAIATAALRLWQPAAVEPANPDAVAVPSNPARAAEQSQAMIAESLEQQTRAKAQQEADARREAAVKQHEAEEETARRAAALEARRERDWQATYKKPAHCDPALPNIDSVGCANDYIRARRQFDAQFNASVRR